METPPEPKYGGLPRRYEDTKPALDQVFTHSSILRIGGRILEKFEENTHGRKLVALKDNEARIWAEAEEYKDKCVRAALEQAAREEAVRLKELENQHSQHMAYEVRRVQDSMHQQGVEDRYEERKNGERKMQEMADQMRKQHELEKLAEVKAARIEEQGIAENASLEMMRRNEEAMRILTVEMVEAKESELAALRLKLEDYRQESIKQARKEEQDQADMRLKDADNAHQEEVQQLTGKINQLLSVNSCLESDLNSMTRQHDIYVEKYMKLRKEFTGFIESCRPDFSSGQADFLLPPN